MLAYCRVRSVFPFILFSTLLHSHRNANPRKSCHSFAHCVPFHSFHFQGICLFPPCKSMWLQPCSASLHTASPPHTYTLSVHSLQYTPFVHYFQPLPFPTHRSGKKMRQTSCRQHPSTALRASCVRGTRSTRSGSHTTHRLNTSFRFSTLAFQPCYPRTLKAVFTIRFKPASPTPTPDHPPQRKLQLMFNSDCNAICV